MSSMEDDKDTKNIPVFNLFDAGGDDSTTDFFGSLIKSNTEPKAHTPAQNSNVDSLFGGPSSGASFFDSLGQNNGQSGSTTQARPFENSPGIINLNIAKAIITKGFLFYYTLLKCIWKIQIILSLEFC